MDNLKSDVKTTRTRWVFKCQGMKHFASTYGLQNQLKQAKEKGIPIQWRKQIYNEEKKKWFMENSAGYHLNKVLEETDEY